MYPDVIDNVKELAPPGVKNFIVDSELVAYDKNLEKILPFQTLSQRSRKHITKADLDNHVAVFAFDLLLLNGEPLIKKTLQERRQILRTTFKETKGNFYFAQNTDCTDFDALDKFLQQSIRDGSEGLMVKTLNTKDCKDATLTSTYEPSKRSFNWLKLKKDYLDDLGDSLDLVVVGADYGTGKRVGWYGSFLMACYDEETGMLQTIARCGSGFTDEKYNELLKTIKPLIRQEPSELLFLNDSTKKGESITCDVWLEPKFVWEIKAADLSLSDMHTAGYGLADKNSPNKGVALRFNRHIRDRPDKKITDATTTA